MELTPFQRFTAFAVVVLVLIGLGAYLFSPQSSAAGKAHSLQSGRPGSGASPGQGTAGPSTPGPGGTATPGAGPAPDIYQWLPFTSAGLASAAAVTLEFGTDYGTFSYTQNATAYLAPMSSLITSQLAQVLGRAFTAPGLALARVAGKQVSTGSAAILSLRAFGPDSLTFVVSITQRVTNNKGHATQAADYAVTLTGAGTHWQVSDIELASAGNS